MRTVYIYENNILINSTTTSLSLKQVIQQVEKSNNRYSGDNKITAFFKKR
jgi:hypothetical protein